MGKGEQPALSLGPKEGATAAAKPKIVTGSSAREKRDDALDM